MKDDVMNLEQQARRVKLSVTIGGHNANSYVEPYLLNFTYTDHVDGKADDIQFTLQGGQSNEQGQNEQSQSAWQSSWIPQKGTEVVASIVAENWFTEGQNLKLPCGAFKIDEVEFGGPPDVVTIKAVSASLSSGFRDTAKKRAFENTSLKIIAAQLATENALSLFYDGDEYPFNRQDQNSESDLSFLYRLAQAHGMFLKVHDNKIVLTSVEHLEQNMPAMSILRQDKSGTQFSATSYTFKISSAGTGYTHAEVTYTDPTKGETLHAIVKADSESQDLSKPLILDTRVESLAEAISIAKSTLLSHNAKEITANLELMGNPNLVAGLTVSLADFGEFSGQYLIDKAVHTVTGGGGYNTSLELHKSRLSAQEIMLATSESVASQEAPDA